MRDDFDSVVADRFMVLDDVPVPDTWSRVQFKLLDPTPVAVHRGGSDPDRSRGSEPRPTKGRLRRRWMLAAAAVLLVVAAAVVLVERDSHEPAVVTTHTRHHADTTNTTSELSLRLRRRSSLRVC